MLNKGFQFLEQRDSDDTIQVEGVVSKKSPFSTADNKGIYDVIAENLRILYEGLCKVTDSTELLAIREDIQKMYNDMRTNEKFGSIEATEQAKIAKEQATIATEKATEIANTLSDLQKKGKSVTDGILEIKASLADVKKYLDEIGTVQKDVADNAQVATNHANIAKTKAAEASTSEVNAKTSEANALESEKKAKASETAALASETAAKTSETKAKASEQASATSEANAATSEANAKASEKASKESEQNAKESETKSKASEQAAKASEVNALKSENKAKASEVASATSEVNAKESETKAATSEANSKVSETNAKESETHSKQSETNALQSERNALNWAEGTVPDEVAADGTVTKHYSSKHHAEQAKISADKAKASESASKTSETNAKESEDKAKASEGNAATSETNAKTSEDNALNSALNASNSEVNAKKSETNAAQSCNKAKEWAESDETITVDVTYSDGSVLTETYNSAKWHANEAGISAANALSSEEKAALSEAASKNSETIARESEEQASQSADTAKRWAESDEVVETTTEQVTEQITNEDGTTENKTREVKTDHYSAKHYAEKAANIYENALVSETTVMTYSDESKGHMEATKKSEANSKQSEDNAKEYADNAKASEDNAKDSADKALVSESNASDSAETAKKWAMSDVSPDGGFDDASKDGQTQSSKMWATQAKEQAIEATKQKKEVSEYTETVKGVLKQAQDLQTSITEIQTAISELTQRSEKALSDTVKIRDSLSNVVDYKGTVNSYSNLPTTDVKVGDMYNVKTADKSHEIKAGDNVVWNGTEWDNMGGFIDADDLLNGGKNATFGTVKATSVTATTFTGALSGKATTAGTADSANSVDWSKVQNKPTSMAANGGTADRALKADVCTGNAATASAVAWGNVTGKPSTFSPSSHSHSWDAVTGKPSSFPPASHNHDSVYVKKAGDTVTGILDLKSSSTSWVTGRDVAPLRQKTWNQYSPFSSVKTSNGSWENGGYTDNILHWSYITDTNYNNKTNTQTVDIQFKPNGEVVAPAFRGRLYGTADAANSVAWGNVSGKPSTYAPSSHTHAWSQVTGAPATATRWPSWSEVTGKPSSMAANGGNASTVGGASLDSIKRCLGGTTKPSTVTTLSFTCPGGEGLTYGNGKYYGSARTQLYTTDISGYDAIVVNGESGFAIIPMWLLKLEKKVCYNSTRLLDGGWRDCYYSIYYLSDKSLQVGYGGSPPTVYFIKY